MNQDVRNSSLVTVISSQFKQQSAFGTALPEAELNMVLPQTEKNIVEVTKTREDVKDATGQRLLKRLLTGRIGQLGLRFDGTPRLLAGVVAFTYGKAGAPAGTTGATRTHAIEQLTTDEYQPPPTSLAIGSRDDAGPAIISRDVVFNDFSVECSTKSKVTVAATVRTHGAGVAATAGYVLPANTTALIAPARMADCALLIGGVNYSALMRKIKYSFSNNLLVNDDPYIGESVDIGRLERADETTESYEFTIVGKRGDALHQLMEAEAEVAVDLRIGALTDHVRFITAKAILEPVGTGIGFDGEAKRSTLIMRLTPVSVNGAAATRAEAVIAQTERLLQLAA